jgi:hypothetical protein
MTVEEPLSEAKTPVAAGRRRRRVLATLVLAVTLATPSFLGPEGVAATRLDLFRTSGPAATETRRALRAPRASSARPARARVMALTSTEASRAGPLVSRGLAPADTGVEAVPEEALPPPGAEAAPVGLAFLDMDGLESRRGDGFAGGTTGRRPPGPPSVLDPIFDPPLETPTTEPSPEPQAPLTLVPPPATPGRPGQDPLPPDVGPRPTDGVSVPPPDPRLPLAGVPEPQTWALMLLGFGALGAMLRRRRAAAQTASFSGP